jgi:FMN phosphatase YigB (HAD superfamily)
MDRQASPGKPFVLFDLGGTLIFDPFPEVLGRLGPDLRTGLVRSPFPADAVGAFLDEWAAVNNRLNFPFAAHFLQEEVFIWQAILSRIDAVDAAVHAELPVIIAELLAAYRRRALAAVAGQGHLDLLRRILAGLTGRGAVLGVASNDREYATRALLAWADLAPFFGFVFTSEGLSQRHPGAEKPSPAFFEAVKREIGPAAGEGELYYVGDDETRDVETPRACGFRTIRLLLEADPAKTWVDNPAHSAADHVARSLEELDPLFERIF